MGDGTSITGQMIQVNDIYECNMYFYLSLDGTRWLLGISVDTSIKWYQGDSVSKWEFVVVVTINHHQPSQETPNSEIARMEPKTTTRNRNRWPTIIINQNKANMLYFDARPLARNTSTCWRFFSNVWYKHQCGNRGALIAVLLRRKPTWKSLSPNFTEHIKIAPQDHRRGRTQQGCTPMACQSKWPVAERPIPIAITTAASNHQR